MARETLLVVQLGVIMLMLQSASAAVISQDNSPVCESVEPACEAKCRGQEYFFICAAGSGPLGTPYVICRCANPAPPVGGPQQSECDR